MKAYGIPDKLIRMVKIMYDVFECSVLDEGEQTRWFKITNGVKQGCVMSGFLFLLAIDWVMRRTTEGQRNGIRWNFTTTLDDLDFANDIALVSSKYEHIQHKTDRLVDNAGRVGLKLNEGKCKAMRTNARREDKVKIGNEEVEDVEEFVYLGETVIKDGGGHHETSKQSMRGLFQPDEDLENTEYWSKHKNQPVQDTGATSSTVWMRTLEDNQNRREEAGQIPVHVLEKYPKNMVAETRQYLK